MNWPTRRCRRSAAVLAMLLAALNSWRQAVHAAEATLPLTAPVKVLSSGGAEKSAAGPVPAMAAQSDRPQPTLPAGKLPQYQLDHRHLSIPAAREREDPRLRLILALPAEPLLIEARITIDGQPFHMVRERRIEQLLEQTASGSEAATAPQRIRHYRQATGEAPTKDELRWLLTHWEDGPTLLLLKDNFQRFRANQRPAFEVLDRDRDGVVAADELERAVQSFQECDLNRNDIIEYTELAEVAADPRWQKSELAGRGKLIFLLPDESSAAAVYHRLATYYSAHDRAIVPRLDLDANGRFDAGELAGLRQREPDLTLTIGFDPADPGQSRISCTAISAALTAAANGALVQGSTITLPVAGTLVAFSALQGPTSDQIAVGAIHDGYPLLPRIDPNEDGRITIRELRSLGQRLRQQDHNQDGRLAADEAQSTIRVCFALGPHVHAELADIRRLATDANQASVGPEWFIRMDRNQDNDLTRGEFPGTNEQFDQLDADGDQLISAEEASRLDKPSLEPVKDSRPEPNE